MRAGPRLGVASFPALHVGRLGGASQRNPVPEPCRIAAAPMFPLPTYPQPSCQRAPISSLLPSSFPTSVAAVFRYPLLSMPAAFVGGIGNMSVAVRHAYPCHVLALTLHPTLSLPCSCPYPRAAFVGGIDNIQSLYGLPREPVPLIDRVLPWVELLIGGTDLTLENFIWVRVY